MREMIYPVEGRVIREPNFGRLVPDEGAEYPVNSYWRRLERDGDVTIGKPPTQSGGFGGED